MRSSIMSSEPDFTKLLQAVHGKLGTVQLCELRNTGVAWFAGQGATVTLVYNTRFQSTYAAASFSIFSKTTQIRAFFSRNVGRAFPVESRKRCKQASYADPSKLRSRAVVKIGRICVTRLRSEEHT